MGLQGFEKRLERMVDGVVTRAFRSELQPVELGRRLAREMDLSTRIGVRGERVAPNHFVFRLSAPDYERLAELESLLVPELVQLGEDHASEQDYALKGPTAIELDIDDALRVGQFSLKATVKPGQRPTRPIAWLVLADGRRVPIHADATVSIGRLPECEIVLADPNASRRHAEVRLAGRALTVVDLESLNGTKVNGRGVPAGPTGRILSAGDEIVIGSTTITVEEPAPTPRRGPRV